MAVFNHVLCPVDTSPFSGRALRFAQRLTLQFGGELQIVSVRPSLPLLGVWAAHNLMLPAEMPDEREQALAALRRFAQSHLGVAPPALSLRDGVIVPEILRAATEWPADLIVMGTHGASGFERLMLGSVTERVLRKTVVPVFTIPRHAPDDATATLARVLCAYDRSAAATRALEYAARLARAASARLIVSHVVEHMIDEDARFVAHFDTEACFRATEPALRDWYARRIAATVPDLVVDLDVRAGKASAGVLEVAAEQRAEVIVAGTASAAGLFGSTAHDIVRRAPMPVLVVPPPTDSA